MLLQIATLTTIVFGLSSGATLPPPIPPATRTPELEPVTYGPITMPEGCYTPEGDMLMPGEQKTYPSMHSCTIYECGQNGELQQMVGDCLPPMCVDAVMGSCCLYCPNGENCELPSGEVIPAGTTVESDGMLCQCPSPLTFFGTTVEPKAVCVEQTTLPIPPTTFPPQSPPQEPEIITTPENITTKMSKRGLLLLKKMIGEKKEKKEKKMADRKEKQKNKKKEKKEKQKNRKKEKKGKKKNAENEKKGKGGA